MPLVDGSERFDCERYYAFQEVYQNTVQKYAKKRSLHQTKRSLILGFVEQDVVDLILHHAVLQELTYKHKLFCADYFAQLNMNAQCLVCIIICC